MADKDGHHENCIADLVALLCTQHSKEQGGHCADKVESELRGSLARVPFDELAHRTGQARFLLSGMQDVDCPTEERSVVRDSFLLQPEYFHRPLRIVHETPHFIFLDKPFDVQIGHGRNQAARFDGERTVEEILRADAPGRADEPLLKRCHNLDFATSGVLMMAKTQEGLSAASRAFDHARAGAIITRKEYCAVVLGWPEWDKTVIDAPIDGDPTSDFKMRVTELLPGRVDGSNVVSRDVAARWGPSRLPPAPRWDRDGRAAKARDALTHAEVVRRGTLGLAGPLKGVKVALVKLLPTTGRRHQLRVHLASAGHPILGDVAYAGDISTHRLCLHAAAITFEHHGADCPVLPTDGLRIATHPDGESPFDTFVCVEN